MADTGTSLKIPGDVQNGVNEIVKPGVMQYLSFSLVQLDEGGSETVVLNDREAALVILNGVATIEVGDKEFAKVGGRPDVFSGSATTVYAPARTTAKISAPGPGPVRVGVCMAPSELEREPVLITPDDVKVKDVGRANWSRQVKDIIDYTFEAGSIVVGETVNAPGNWSSAPPHKHEVDNPPHEVELEEVYFFQVKPTQGFGFQRVYTDDRSLDETYTLEQDDTVMIPKGYHPIAAAPGYQLYYLWFLAGPTSRVLRPKDDADHSWLKAVEPVLDGLG